MLCGLAGMTQLPWCIVGDCNDILAIDDKLGHVPHPPWLLRGFREAIQHYGLSEIPLEGVPVYLGQCPRCRGLC